MRNWCNPWQLRWPCRWATCSLLCLIWIQTHKFHEKMQLGTNWPEEKHSEKHFCWGGEGIIIRVKNAVLYNNSNYHGYFCCEKKGFSVFSWAGGKKIEIKLLLDWSSAGGSGGAACSPACCNKALPVCSNSRHSLQSVSSFMRLWKKKWAKEITVKKRKKI